MTYREAFNRITEAYINDRLDPYSPCACFIGNLLNTNRWVYWRDGDPCFGEGIKINGADENDFRQLLKNIDCDLYELQDIIDMENNFLRIIHKKLNLSESFFDTHHILSYVEKQKNYEDVLFEAMESTLEMLKKIHERSGEIIDPISFKKRELGRATVTA